MDLDPSFAEPFGHPQEKKPLTVGQGFDHIKSVLDRFSAKDRFAVLRAVSAQYGMNVSFTPVSGPAQSAGSVNRPALPGRSTAFQRLQQKRFPVRVPPCSDEVREVKRAISLKNREIAEASLAFSQHVLPAGHQLLVARDHLFRCLDEAKNKIPPQSGRETQT